jgi:hypothetical protein
VVISGDMGMPPVVVMTNQAPNAQDIKFTVLMWLF